MRDIEAGPERQDPARQERQGRNRDDQAVLITDAQILTFEPSRRLIGSGDVLVIGDRIAAVGQDLAHHAPPHAVRVRADGQLLMPGLVNAHFHSPANFMRGTLDSLPLEIFMLYEVPALDAPVPPEHAYVRTLLGAVEMLKGGITTVQDDAFFIPVPSTDEIDAVMGAYRDSGIRARVALDQQNLPDADKLPFLAELAPPALRERLIAPAQMAAPELLRHYEALIANWHGAEGGRLQAAVSCSAPQRVSEDYFRALDALSARHDLPFYIHMLETRTQRVFGDVCWNGSSLIRRVDDLGLLSDRMNVIHAVWIDDDDIARLARSGAQVVHNPVSNLRLGSGIMPFRRLRDAGVPIALGTDEAIADDAISIWGAAKLAGLVHNIADSDYTRWPTASEILDCVVTGGARAMRQADRIGRVAPGFQADLILIDLDALPFTPLNDLERQLVYCDPSSAIRMTMVAGRILVRDGRMLSIDEAKLRQEARSIAAAEAPRRQRIAEIAAQWLPSYRAMYAAMLQHDVGMSRWVGDAAPHRPGRVG